MLWAKKDRKSKYAGLIKVTNKSIGYAQNAIEAIDKVASISNGLLALRLDLNRYCHLAARLAKERSELISLLSAV